MLNAAYKQRKFRKRAYIRMHRKEETEKTFENSFSYRIWEKIDTGLEKAAPYILIFANLYFLGHLIKIWRWNF